MNKLFLFVALAATSIIYSQNYADTTLLGDKSVYKATKAKAPIVIDADGSDKSWKKAKWAPMPHVWLGTKPMPTDIAGRYKLLWDKDYLYFLVEITDDSLSDQHKSPFDLWWEDDCLELFVDEDNSNDNHQFNHSAFAYHITLDYDVVDMGPDQKPHLYNDHMQVKMKKVAPHKYVWEVAMKVYDKNYVDSSAANKPVVLSKGKKMGYAVSFNDNDGNNVRENFIGSVCIPGPDRNRGWIDSGVFGTVILK
ncbi:MAG TPA: sugar-binding protein [Cytophagales bacterium]|nr:sugar-binding protein [Cytophagales bacterium]